MTLAELITVTTSLATGLAAGFVMHRSDFCIAGAFRDIFMFRSLVRMRSLAILVLAAMILLETARQCGGILIFPFPGFTPPGTGTLLSGIIFGTGMVLSGGCVAGSLYRFGAGSSASLAAVGGIIAGSLAYAEIHPVWKPLAVSMRYSNDIILSAFTGIPHWIAIAFSALLLALFCLCGTKKGRISGLTKPDGYIPPVAAALILGLLVSVTVLLIGIPPGVSTSYAKVGAMMMNVIFPEYVAGTAFFQEKGISYANMRLGIEYAGGSGPFLDAVALIQFPLVLGIVAGAHLSARLLGEFSFRTGIPVRQYVSAVAGGFLMGIAARMAPGCSVWHIMGGLPVLTFSSILFSAGLLPGAWIGSRLLTGLVITRNGG